MNHLPKTFLTTMLILVLGFGIQLSAGMVIAKASSEAKAFFLEKEYRYKPLFVYKQKEIKQDITQFRAKRIININDNLEKLSIPINFMAKAN